MPVFFSRTPCAPRLELRFKESPVSCGWEIVFGSPSRRGEQSKNSTLAEAKTQTADVKQKNRTHKGAGLEFFDIGVHE